MYLYIYIYIYTHTYAYITYTCMGNHPNSFGNRCSLAYYLNWVDLEVPMHSYAWFIVAALSDGVTPKWVGFSWPSGSSRNQSVWGYTTFRVMHLRVCELSSEKKPQQSRKATWNPAMHLWVRNWMSLCMPWSVSHQSPCWRRNLVIAVKRSHHPDQMWNSNPPHHFASNIIWGFPLSWGSPKIDASY